MKLLLDQGLPRTTASLLRDSGIDAIHAGECELANASDREILRRAEAEGRIVVTLDSDFHGLLARSNAMKPSVARIRIEGLRAEAAADLIQRVVTRCEEDLANGCVISIQDDRVRIRKLPLKS